MKVLQVRVKLVNFANYDTFLVGISLLKVSNRYARTKCEIRSKLTIKTPERRH